MLQRAMLAVMSMRHRVIERKRHAVAADLVNRPLFHQRVVLPGGNCHALTGTPVDRLCEADRVVARRNRSAERYPGGTLLAVQVDGAAIEGSQELGAEIGVRCDPVACAQRNGQPLRERALGAAGTQPASTANRDPSSPQLRVARSKEQRSLDVETAYVDVEIEDDRATRLDADRSTGARHASTPRCFIRPAQCAVRKDIGGSRRCSGSLEFEVTHRRWLARSYARS